MVAEVGGAATTVSFGQTNQVTTFTVTNTTNATQDFRLFALNTGIGSPTQLGHTDNFGVTNIRVFVDVNGNGTYDAATDTATYIDELAPDADQDGLRRRRHSRLGPGQRHIGRSVDGRRRHRGAGFAGRDLTQSLLDDPAQIDTVFADAAGYADILRDARFSAGDEYAVAGATAQVTKTAVIISDPMNGDRRAQGHPGRGGRILHPGQEHRRQALTGVGVTDNIPTNTTYLASSTYVGGSVLLGACVPTGRRRRTATCSTARGSRRQHRQHRRRRDVHDTLPRDLN
jgi:hypothetical protein